MLGLSLEVLAVYVDYGGLGCILNFGLIDEGFNLHSSVASVLAF